MKPSVRLAVASLCLLLPSMPFAQDAGGFVEEAGRSAGRAPWTPAQIEGFLPARGEFTFPFPYGTAGIRLTNATDCGGADCVLPAGSSSRRNTNNHRGRETMLVFLGLRGVGPTLFSYSKSTGQVKNLGPLFEAGSPFARHSGDGWYFSGTKPTTLYVTGALGATLQRYDVVARTFEAVFDASTHFGADRYIWQSHSSDDDNVHSATLRDLTSHAKLGCLAYREDTRRYSYYAALDDFSECRIDRSGRWLVIKEDVDGLPGRENLVVDLETGTEEIALDPTHTEGPIACSAAATTGAEPRVSEIVCRSVDGSPDVLVVTQAMADLNARRVGDRAFRLPNGNLDVTGRYFTWVSDMAGIRSDAFIVKVPARLRAHAGRDATSQTNHTLENPTPQVPDTTPPTISGVGAAGIVAVGATVTWVTNEASTTQVQFGTTTAYGSQSTFKGALVTAHAVTLGGLTAGTLYHYRVKSRDATGNLTVSGDFVFTTLEGTPPSVAITAPSAGASVSGAVTVTANASDNVAVVGVQFKLDGADLGAEDTTPPYSVPWNTTTGADGSHALAAIARDGAGNTKISSGVTVTAANGNVVVTLAPQDTFIKLDTTNQSTSAQLLTYTWPNNQVANAILMKFNLSAIPPGVVVTDATLQLALVASDTAPESTYTVTANKILGRNPVIATATGYTADGVTAWTPSACCYNGVPLGQADISAPYDSRAIDKIPGYKSWGLTTMVQEWLANPTANYGVLLNSDTSKLADRYRTFASVEHADPTLRPYLRVTYTLATDVTPPVISAVLASAATPSGATIGWTTNEPGNTQVEYGPTTAYGSSTTLNASLVLSHSQALSGLASGTLYHYRVKSGDAAGNLATSADFTVTTLEGVLPTVAITAPTGGATVSGTVTVAANASDNVAVVGVQFKLNGTNLGAEDTTSPYSVSWDTLGVANDSHALTAVARDAAGNTATSAGVTVTVENGGVIVSLAAQDTSIKLDATNQSTNPQLMTYTWPSNQVANAILMKFDLSAIPPAAVVTDATLQLALLESDTAPESTYTITANKMVGRSPVIATATGYTADGVTTWTPNACCSGGVPLAQADISAPYDSRAIDKTPGYKSWSIAAMAQEWVANPATNFGLLLNSDATKLADRYRTFASMEHADPTLRPSLRITYSLAPDVTPPLISAVLASALTTSGATVTWTTNEPSNTQVEYGPTTAYGSLTTLNASLVTAHVSALGGLTPNTLYHYRVRSRDFAGNLAVSGDSTFTTLALDLTPPVVSITAPTGGATVANTVTVTASATDNVGVVGVQFKLDGANVGAEDTASPYSYSWNTATAPNGSHTLTAVARDAAGNTTPAPGVAVTVNNAASPAWPNEPSGFTPTEETGWESGTLENWYRIFTSADKPITVKDVGDSSIGESKALDITFNAGHVGGGGTELRFDVPAALRRTEMFVGFYIQLNSQWQGHSSAINKMLYLADGGAVFSAMWYEQFGSGSNPLGLYVVNQSGGSPPGFHENVTPVTFTRGVWNKVEIYQKQGAANNGIVRVWVNGVLAIDRSDVNTKSTPIDNVTISGIWGGVGDSKNQTDYMRFDRIRVSRPGP